MLHLILVFMIIYKVLIEEKNYLLLQSNLFNAIILQLLRNELSNSIDNPSAKLNQKIISDNKKIEVPSLTVKTEVIETHTSNNQSSEKEERDKAENIVLTDSLVNDSIPTTTKIIQCSTLNDIIQSNFKGSVVNVFLSNKDNISGEVILNFKEFIALKSGNITVWVNPESVDAAF